MESINKENEDIIVCRCEEVTEREIIEAVRAGATTLNTVKRRVRAGMGHCQSNSCSRHIIRIISEELGIPVSEIKNITSRPPAIPVTVNLLNTYNMKVK